MSASVGLPMASISSSRYQSIQALRIENVMDFGRMGAAPMD